ncbi:hypothetical protein H8A95_36735, partial [Bradyrhizobium sp. Pear76]|uniref:hypothetical protein n=1 Tax=Bradyrhizobium oropedii TaxID=1571201 RepID=UPI001E51FBB9
MEKNPVSPGHILFAKAQPLPQSSGHGSSGKKPNRDDGVGAMAGTLLRTATRFLSGSVTTRGAAAVLTAIGAAAPLTMVRAQTPAPTELPPVTVI